MLVLLVFAEFHEVQTAQVVLGALLTDQLLVSTPGCSRQIRTLVFIIYPEKRTLQSSVKYINIVI